VNESEWRERFLENIAGSSMEGLAAAEYAQINKIRVGIRHAGKAVGGFWTLRGNIFLNSIHYTMDSSLRDPRAWTLFIHEVRHLQQGMITALSIFGELDAWQYEFKVYKRITGKNLDARLEEILALPLNYDRPNLQHARTLMIAYARKGYAAGILPLYPLTREVRYWFTAGINPDN